MLCSTTSFVVVLILSLSAVTSSVRVTIKQGELEGEWIEAATGDGFKFASFRSIPYALPPVGPLRFKAPRLPPKWEGVRNASVESTACVQKDGNGISGSEDCLYLNVYTPSLPDDKRSKLRPVFIFFYGGAFRSGSNSMDNFGPDYLVHEELVVVIPNFRTNAFGYLSLDTEEVPGNAAMKDQISSVEWVYKNIDKFGGDPNQITVGGQSSGCQAAHFAAQVPALEGKIRRVILMSGSAYHSWAYKENFLDVAMKLGQRITNSSANFGKEELTKLFMETTTEELGLPTAMFAEEAYVENGPTQLFAPTPERRPAVPNGEPRVITRDMESYFIKREVPPVPVLIGSMNREWTENAQLTFGFYNVTTTLNRIGNLMSLIPKNIVPFQDTERLLNIKYEEDPALIYPDVIREIKAEYFDSQNASCDIRCKADLYSDNIYFQTDTNRLAQYRAKFYPSVPVYLYRFSLTAAYNPSFLGKGTEHLHGDDLHYVFRRSSIPQQDYNGSDIAAVTLRRMTRMFANFIRYGKPVPFSSGLLPFEWKRNRSAGPKVTLINIDDTVTLRHEELPGQHVQFWEDIYRRYRKPRRGSSFHSLAD